MTNREKEVYKFLEGVVKGEIMEPVQLKEKDQLGNPLIAEVPVAISVRMKAAELILKTIPENNVAKSIIPVILSDDIK